MMSIGTEKNESARTLGICGCEQHAHRSALGLPEDGRSLRAGRIVLDTAAPLLEAAALYRSAGYRDIPRFNDNPVAVAWFGKDLA